MPEEMHPSGKMVPGYGRGKEFGSRSAVKRVYRWKESLLYKNSATSKGGENGLEKKSKLESLTREGEEKGGNNLLWGLKLPLNLKEKGGRVACEGADREI